MALVSSESVDSGSNKIPVNTNNFWSDLNFNFLTFYCKAEK